MTDLPRFANLRDGDLVRRRVDTLTTVVVWACAVVFVGFAWFAIGHAIANAIRANY